MNADKPFVFNPRLSAFIGGYRSGRYLSTICNNSVDLHVAQRIYYLLFYRFLT